jgi:hypothetical protein
MSISTPDERERAFEALLPLAAKTQDVLDRVQSALDDEHRLVSPLRAGFHPTQRAGLTGSCRHALTVLHWGAMLEASSVSRICTDSQEAQSLFMWLLDDRYVLRVKHDLTEVVDPGTATLFSLAPQDAKDDPVAVFLTWETTAERKIRRVSFATTNEPAWTIPLTELLAAASPTVTVTTRPPLVLVRSKRDGAGEHEQGTSAAGGPSTDHD